MIEQNKIPKHWQVKKLGEVCEIKNGKNQKLVVNANGKYPIYGSAGVMGFADEYLCEAGSTIVGRKGTINKPLYVKTQFWNFDTAFGFSPNKELIDSRFLYFFCLSFNFSKLDKSTTIPSLAKTDLQKIDVILPRLPEQQLIVSKIEELLSELENGKQQLLTAQQQLKVYRQSLLKWAFEGKLTNKNVKEGELPKGWKKVQIKDVAETFGGYAFKSGEFLPQGKYQVLRMGNVRPGVIRYSESPVYLDKVDENVLNRALLQTNDVIITQTGTRKKRDYGFTVLITKPNLLLNQRIASIRFNESYLPKFFLYFSWTDLFKDQFFANETGNVGQGNVGMKAVTETLIPFLSYNEQLLIVEELESKLTVCDKIEETISQSLQQAETLRQSILKKAFEGKLVENKK
ncbi:MAG: restriction endonuclease subunit S [Bacteroidetes bacterium]|nr:restriction endonuclease subunit S [Bacteroidota bacterium]